MKYILVSGGVISGIGKGVIGSSSPSHSTALRSTRLDLDVDTAYLLACVPVCSFVDWIAAQDARLQCHGDQDRPVHEHRRRHNVADRARQVASLPPQALVDCSP